MKVIVADSSGLIPLDKQFAFSFSYRHLNKLLLRDALIKILNKTSRWIITEEASK